jgi:hypothetical protein
MVAMAAIGLVAFIVHLTARRRDRVTSSLREQQIDTSKPKWFEYLLAIVTVLGLIVAVIAVIVYWYPFGAGDEVSWRSGTRPLIFLVGMLLIGVVALTVFIVTTISRRFSTGRILGEEIQTDISQLEPVRAPAGIRLLGLLVVAIAFLALNWIAVDKSNQYLLMAYLMYPATVGVALVLLFDKATRAWSAKRQGEPIREWIFCDGMVFLLFLSFLNLVNNGGTENYNVLFWDVLYVTLFFFVFWLVDRKVTRYRFLVAYTYFLIAPIMLFIWRIVRGVQLPETLSWWSTVWPFAVLAGIFMIIEIIALSVTRGSNRQAGGAIRDVIFIVLYGVCLLVAQA